MGKRTFFLSLLALLALASTILAQSFSTGTTPLATTDNTFVSTGFDLGAGRYGAVIVINAGEAATRASQPLHVGGGVHMR